MLNKEQKVEPTSENGNSTKPPVVGIPKRTIEFRFWLGHTKKMTYEHSLIEIAHCHWDFTEDIIPLQFTGLVDKNGVKIFEGDIVKSGYQADEAHPVTVEDFHGIRFMIGKNQLVRGDAMDGEVIGNVFEPPELLG